MRPKWNIVYYNVLCRNVSAIVLLRKDWKNSQVCLSYELHFIGLSMLKYSIVQKSSWDGNITAKKISRFRFEENKIIWHYDRSGGFELCSPERLILKSQVSGTYQERIENCNECDWANCQPYIHSCYCKATWKICCHCLESSNIRIAQKNQGNLTLL